uniref:F-box domain-containing protein n=1 Tax=Brassica campestris TaxID=3711 RepID=M4D2G0_BRACM
MIDSSVQAAASAVVEPRWKKRKPNPSPPSFSSLPDVIILNCLARISMSYYPILSLVSKTFRSLILSRNLNHARSYHKTQEKLFYICLQLPDRPLPSWFTLWIKPYQTEEENMKKKKATLVQVPSSYALRELLLVRTVGSDIYALRPRYPPSPFMLVRNKERDIWRNTPNMTVSRVNPAACVLHGKIYVMGGCNANKSAKSWGKVFDTETRTWEPLPDPGDELRFSSVIRKIKIIRGKLLVRSTDEKDSVYDPKTRNVACGMTKRVTSGNMSRGLSSFNRSCRRGLIKTVEYCGKLLILWDKFAHCEEKTICCALVALEKRQNGQVWGKVEWSSVVLTVPSSYVFLRSSVIRI